MSDGMEVLKLRASITLDRSEYEANLKETEAHFKQAAGDIQQESNNISTSTVVMGNLLAEAIKKGVTTMISLGKQGVQYNAQIQSYTQAITTALGGTAEAAKKAEKVIAQIKQDAAVTPFSVDGLTKANMLLISTGESAEDARATVMALSEAVSATGGGNEELQRMAQNLQQIKNVGKASAMDIRQFAMAGIDIYGILADYTGKTTAEVQQFDVTYELLSDALIKASEEGGRFYESNLKQSQTLNGQWSTLTDNISMKLGEAFGGVSDTLTSKILPAINDFIVNLDIDKATDSVTTFGIALGGLAATFNADKILSGVNKIKSGFAALTTSTGLLGIALTTIAVAVKSGSDAFDEAVDTMSSYGETSDEIRQKIAELEQQIADSKAADELYGTYTDNDAAIIALSNLKERLVEVEEAERLAAEENASLAESMGLTSDATAEEVTQLQELATAYADSYDKISQSVSNYFDTFENAGELQQQSIADMTTALQSQIDFNNQFAENLATISQSGVEGMDKIAQAIGAMGKDGASYAAELAQAISDKSEAGKKKVQELADKFGAVKESEKSLSEVIASTTNEFAALRDAACGDVNTISSALNSLNRTVTIYYNGVVTGTHLNNVASSQTYTSSYSSSYASTSSSSTSTNATKVASNITSLIKKKINGYATGLDYVPYDNMPALLHKGERVLTATENKDYNSQGGAGYTQSTQPINLDVTLSLDGATIAKKIFKYNKAEERYHGNSLIMA